MNIYEKISEINKDTEAFLYTVIDGESTGQKAIAYGGKVEFFDENSWFSNHSDEVKTVNVTGISEVCGQRIYSELIGSDKTMVICGAGHISMAIIDLAQMLGFHVIVIDDRIKFAGNAIRKGADEVICKEFGDALNDITGSQDHYFVIVTRGHRFDRECLKMICEKPHAYIGMLGSKRRTILVKQELAEDGVDEAILDSIHTPIGLKIGAETPEEIAIAIMAEIIEVKNQNKNYGFPDDILKMLCDTEREPAVLATIISRRGSAPRGIGTKMLIYRGGDTIGTIGGGCIEGSVIQKGRRMLLDENHKPAIVNVDMSNETAEDEGMVCGGTVDVLLEVV